MITILAEKPSQAAAYAGSFSTSVKKQGYFEVRDPIFGTEEVRITHAIGHLVELAAPEDYSSEWKEWTLEKLPILPEKYQFVVSDHTKSQFQIVSQLVKDAETIIIATDPAREGENIAWSILHKCGITLQNKKVLRYWTNSQEKEAVRKGFSRESLREAKEFYPLYQEARTRQISDWVLGMNGSRLYTILLQKESIKGVFSYGRVQTATLLMINRRQTEIDHFKKEKYLVLSSTVTCPEGTFGAQLKPAEKFHTMDQVNDWMKGRQLQLSGNNGTVSSVERVDKSTNSPKLFDLNSLQIAANKKFGASATDVLKSVQRLYEEKKYLTYPRTEFRHITENEYVYLKEELPSYLDLLAIHDPELTDKRSSHVNPSKVGDHCAVIPTKTVPSAEELAELQPLDRQLYELVLRTTLAMFYPEYLYLETILTVDVNSTCFEAKGQVEKRMGWKELFPDELKSDTILPDLTEGSRVIVALSPQEKETTPPKLYTEGSLLAAMENAAGEVEDPEAKKILKEVKGIGTPATRSDTIETLKKRKYIVLKGKSIVITEQGKILCSVVESEGFVADPLMTARWELYLKEIGKGNKQPEGFLQNINKYVQHLINDVPAQFKEKGIQEKIEQFKESSTVGKCPKCGKVIVDRGKFYSCTGYPDCRFTLPKVYLKKSLSLKMIQDLLTKRRTGYLKGFESKAGKKFTSPTALILNADGSIGLEFQQKKAGVKK